MRKIKFADVRTNLNALHTAGLLEVKVNAVGKSTEEITQIFLGVISTIQSDGKEKEIPEEVGAFFNDLVDALENKEEEPDKKEKKDGKKKDKKEEKKKTDKKVVESKEVKKDVEEPIKKEKKKGKRSSETKLKVYDKWVDEGSKKYNTEMARKYYAELELDGVVSFSYVHHLLYFFSKMGQVPKERGNK